MSGSNVFDRAAFARKVLAACGTRRVLQIGAGDGALVGALLAQGGDAFGLDDSPMAVAAGNARFPGRFRRHAGLPLPCGDGEFDTVVSAGWIEGLADEEVPIALAEMYRACARYVFLRVPMQSPHAPDPAGPPRDRAWWEKRCFEAGFRKHAAYYRVNPYAALNDDGDHALIPLEKVRPETLASYPLSALEDERLLHMDMLREPGRRADAHCIRYHMAAAWIRPGDVVLDLACGYGYGSHILFQNSLARSVLGIDLSESGIAYAQANYGLEGAVRFECGNAQDLSTLADRSVDFIASFETIEHLPDPDAYLDELQRVLKPSGRLMICAPNDWTDETGRDPNPHHLHVYTWDRLRDEVGARFLLEKGFVQTAGGAMKCHHSPRAWAEVPLAPLEREAEWIILLAMSDPLAGADVPYLESAWAVPADADFHVSAFARDYRNPWLVKGMVALGSRCESPQVLRAMQAEVMRTEPPDSVDHGAALCGHVYSLLAEPFVEASAALEALERIRAYAALPDSGPHRLRWQVSLLFAGGELARKRGDRAAARELYERCAAIDTSAYSPLLGNRTLDALFRLATFAMDDGDAPRARSLLARSVSEAERLCSGSWLNVRGAPDRPLPFGLAELSQLLDKASRAAYALAALDSGATRPAVFAAEAQGFHERLLAFKESDLAALRAGNEGLVRELSRLTARVDEFARELIAKEARIHELGAEVVRQDAHAQSLAREIQRRDAMAAPLATAAAKLASRLRDPRAAGSALVRRLRRMLRGAGK